MALNIRNAEAEKLAYALARAFGESLLFKDNDFSQTDVVPALPPPDRPANPRLR